MFSCEKIESSFETFSDKKTRSMKNLENFELKKNSFDEMTYIKNITRLLFKPPISSNDNSIS